MAGALALGCVFSPAVSAQESAVGHVSFKDKDGKEVGSYKESHALVIGAGEYTNGWPKLRGVKKDVLQVSEALRKQGFNVVLVEDPSREKMLAAFEDFISRYGQEPENRLVVYYAGHGHTLELSTNVKMGYLVPVEAPNPGNDRNGFLATAVDMEQIQTYAKRFQSKHVLFLFDSCFSGSVFYTSRAVPMHITDKTSKPVRQFITAGSENEEVPDESIFRSQFVAALNGEADYDKDGFLTGTELGMFLQNTVVEYSRKTQQPQFGKIRDPNLDKGDFVFVMNAAAENPLQSKAPKVMTAQAGTGDLRGSKG